MSDYPKFSFHESLILQFKKIGNSILLELQEVDLGENKCQVLITCTNIRKFETDAKEKGPDFMAAADGEVLTLNVLAHRIELIVQWHNHLLHSHDINFYYVDCEKVNTELISTRPTQ